MELVDWKQLFTHLPPPQAGDAERFSTEGFLHDILHGRRDLADAKVFAILDRLCKKIDVVGSLRTFYSADLARGAGPKAGVRSEYAALMLAVLLQAAESQSDLKFLNTALKILDGDLRQAAEFPLELSHWADQLLLELVHA